MTKPPAPGLDRLALMQTFVRIVEAGSHTDLVDRPGGHYARLYQLQQGLA